MTRPHVYMCPPHLEPPSHLPPHLPLTSLLTLSIGLFQSTGFGCPASCTALALAIYLNMVMYIKVKSGSHSVISDSCNPMDCSLPGSSVHGILQTRIPEWEDYPFSKGSSWPRNQTGVSCITGRFFTSWATREEVIYICQRYSLTSSHPCLLPISKFKVHHNGLIYVYIIKYICTYIYIFLIHSPIDGHRLSPCPGYTATINMV